jgi:hypothetical protein
MTKYRRHRNSTQRGFVQRHRDDCLCAGDHCGVVDALRAARRWRVENYSQGDDSRTWRLATSIGLQPQRRGG